MIIVLHLKKHNIFVQKYPYGVLVLNLPLPSVQFWPVLPDMHTQLPVYGSHVWLLLQLQISEQLFPKKPSAHSENIKDTHKITSDKAIWCL